MTKCRSCSDRRTTNGRPYDKAELLPKGPFREGAVTEGDWGSMRERVICCCDMAVEERLQKTPSVICFANATSLKREAYSILPSLIVFYHFSFRSCADLRDVEGAIPYDIGDLQTFDFYHFPLSSEILR